MAPFSPLHSTAAQRFQTSLLRSPAQPPQPLPHFFQPLVRAIAGSRPVAMRTGVQARSALAAAGKAAATIGGVIHLPRVPDRSAASAEMVAHELVHVAHPSPHPRFFGDDHRGPEEALATHVGALARNLMVSRPVASTLASHRPDGLARALDAPRMAPAPARPGGDRLAWGTQGLPVSSLGSAARALSRETSAPGSASVQRQARPSAARSSSLVERTADLFRQSTRAPAPASAGFAPADHNGSAADLPRPGDPPIIRRSTWATAQPTTTGSPEVAGAAEMVPGISRATFDALVEALEQRVIDELERRGLRHDPGVF